MFANISIWTIIRIIFSLIFVIMCNILNNFIIEVEKKDKCIYSTGWKITQGKFISSILLVIGAINIIIPINKFISTLPIIGSSYIIIFVIFLFSLFYIMTRLCNDIYISKTNKCNLPNYKTLIYFFKDKTILECIITTVIISILMFYL